MKSKNGIAVLTGIIIFALLIASAIYLQSAYLLYAATAIPILLVPFLPDLSGSKVLKPGRPGERLRIYRTSTLPGEGFLIIEAEAGAGAIPWNKKRLYFPLKNIPVQSEPEYAPAAAALPVLLFDLIQPDRKKNLYGIELANLNDRIRTLSYTKDEVTRLVIRMEDLEALDPVQSAVRSAQVGKGLEA